MRRLGPLAALLVALLLSSAGCGGGSTKLIASGDLPRLVLQRADVPAWTRFQNDSGTAADVGFLGSADRISAWIARYRRANGVIVSRIDLYRSVGAAHDVFKAFRAQAAGSGVGSLEIPALGEERVGYTVGTAVVLDSVFWRRSNAIVSIVWQGSRVNGHDVNALAERADTRVREGLR